MKASQKYLKFMNQFGTHAIGNTCDIAQRRKDAKDSEK